MPDSSLSALTASTPATAGLLYTVQGGADRKLSMTSAGAAMIEAADAAAQAALMTALLAKAGGTMTGALVNSTNGASGAPSLHMTGSIFTGGSSTTTKPLFLLEPAGATSTAWATTGTALGINLASGSTADILHGQLNGASRIKVTSTGALTVGNTAVNSASIVLQGSDRSGTLGFSPSGSGFAINGIYCSANLGFGDAAASLGFGNIGGDGVNNSKLFISRQTNAQALLVTNTFSSATSFEALEQGWAGNVAHLWTSKGSGGGSARELHLGYDSSASIKLGASGAIDFSGLTAGADVAVASTHSVTMKIGGTSYKVLLATP